MTRGPIFSRRRFLGASLAAGGAMVLGASALLALRGRAPRVPGLRCLSPHHCRTLDLLAQALFPPSRAFPRGAGDADLARRFDQFLADEPAWNQDDLKKGLVLLELGPLVFDRKLTTLSRLSPEERLAHFERWTKGTLLQRQVALALRRFLTLVFYDRPEAWKAIGYDGPLLAAVRP